MPDDPMQQPRALPDFPRDAQVCGNCKLWQLHSEDHRGWVGPCRIQPNRGLFPPSAPICDAFVSKHGLTRSAPVESESARRVPRAAPVIIRRKQQAPNALIDLEGLGMTREELMEIFRDAAGDSEAPPMAAKWEGGTVRLLPGKADVQSKDLPIDALFHKVVMIRDRLRTLEQKLNGHTKLSDAEKVEMQHYITRVYGSLTSFNLLFKDKGDQFVGAKTDD
jgi:hypothetical protein